MTGPQQGDVDAAPRTVVVTGGGSGLGREIALTFAAQGAGVVVNDYSGASADAVVAEITARGGTATAHAGDVADEDSVLALVALAREWTGRVDVLVNNAGIADTVTPTATQCTADWQRVVDVCLRGTYLLSRHIGAEFMLPSRSGRIVNMASIAGVVGLPMRNAYSAAKAGIVMMTRTMGSEWAGRGVTVNAVAPGYIRTAMTDDLVRQGKLDEAGLIRRIPAGHLGEARDVAAAVVFLASPEARYITGTCLPVDGGWCAFGSAGPASFD